MARTPNKETQPFSLRLDADSVALAEAVAQVMGIGRSDVFRVAVRVLAKQQGIELPLVPPSKKREQS